MIKNPTPGVDEQFCSLCGEVIKPWVHKHAHDIKATEICPKCGARLKNPPISPKNKTDSGNASIRTIKQKAIRVFTYVFVLPVVITYVISKVFD